LRLESAFTCDSLAYLGYLGIFATREGGVGRVAEVKIQEGESIESALRRFKRKVQQEDIMLCTNVQKGLNSSTYDRGRYSVKRENGVHHFHMLLREFLER